MEGATAADKRANVERVDNGWVLTYWTRDRSEMTSHREVYASFGQMSAALASALRVTPPPALLPDPLRDDDEGEAIPYYPPPNCA